MQSMPEAPKDGTKINLISDKGSLLCYWSVPFNKDIAAHWEPVKFSSDVVELRQQYSDPLGWYETNPDKPT